jgi:hypothetical protein
VPHGEGLTLKEDPMKRLIIAAALVAFSIGGVVAQAPGTCESKAIDRNGKALAGAARTSFLHKCKRDECAPKAVDKNGKALRGAAKKSFMQKCERETG